MKRRWLIALALPALAATCGGSDDTSALRAQVAALQTQVAPDRVVGIEIRCDFWPTEGSHRDYWGAICSEYYGTDAAGLVADSSIGVREGSSGGGAFNRRKVLTIRGPVYSYTVAVPLTSVTAVGDEWPPK